MNFSLQRMTAPQFASIPNQGHYWLTNTRIPLSLLDSSVTVREPIPWLAASPQSEELIAADIEIQGGKIAAIAPVGSASEDVPTVDLRQGLVWPCFVDIHTHLDKAHTWHRTPNPDGTFGQALKAIDDDRIHYWKAEDLYRRMDFALRCSYAHGTRALRTHLDAFEEQCEVSFAVFKRLQQAWAGRIELQAVNLVPIDIFETPFAETLADLVAESGGILGAVAYFNPNLEHQLDRVFQLAQERNLNLDFHVDESLNPEAQALRHVAQAKLRHRCTGTVVCGHCCSLSVQPVAVTEETMRWVKEAELGVISLPMCNLFLQDRQTGRMPRSRGVTLLPELKAHNIPVAVSSDNSRDAFYAYGDLDMLEVFTQTVRIGQLDRPVGDWPQSATSIPAALMGLEGMGTIGVGQSADLVCFKGRTFNELLSRSQRDRIVLRQGKAIDTTLPDYAELDDLLGL